MFYVFNKSPQTDEAPISLDLAAFEPDMVDDRRFSTVAQDVDFVDDALLNTAPHNPIERQLLTGDVIGLALMSGSILWSAMGAIA